MENLSLNAELIFAFGIEFVTIPKIKPYVFEQMEYNGFLARISFF